MTERPKRARRTPGKLADTYTAEDFNRVGGLRLSRCEANAACVSKRRKSESSGKRQGRQAQDREEHQRRRAAESDSERQARQVQDREEHKRGRAAESAEELDARLKRVRERYLLSTGRRRQTYPNYTKDPSEALMFFVDSSVNAYEAATECLAYPCEESFETAAEAFGASRRWARRR